MSAHVKADNQSNPSFTVFGLFDGILLIRILAAILLFAIALLIKMPVLRFILCLLSAAALAYDLALEAVDAVLERDYFATPVLVLFVTVLGFAINCPAEAAAMLLLFRIGLLLIQYAADHTKKDARILMAAGGEDLSSKASQLMEQDGAVTFELEKSVRASVRPILIVMIALALLFGLLVPLFTALSFGEAIHRALIIVLIATPGSLLVSLPLVAQVGLGGAAQHGLVFRSARILEKLLDVKNVAFDKNGVFSESQPELAEVKSDLVDPKNLLHFAAHAVYYSEQPFAKAIMSAAGIEYRLDLISDFTDIPGMGVEVKIGDTPVLFGNQELFASRGEAIPYTPQKSGEAYYMMVAGKYIGTLLLQSELHDECLGLIPALKKQGVRRGLLLMEDSADESERIGSSLDADEVYAELDADRKLSLLEELCGSHAERVMYVYANGFESHSAAGVDLRVSKRGKYADALLLPGRLSELPAAFWLSQRCYQVAVENVIFAFVIKALLIFLSLTGHCSLWFAMFLDMTAALATILNSIRVVYAPLFDLSFLQKTR